MEAFDLAFKLLAACGVWRPINDSTKLTKMPYKLYRTFVISLPYFLTTGLMARLLLDNISFEEFTETLFMLMSSISVCCKSFNFIRQRKLLITMSNMLSSDCARPHTTAEQRIKNEHDKFIRWLTLTLVILVELTALAYLLLPFFQAKNHRSLPFQVWLPFNNSPDNIFWMTYVPDALAITTIASIAVAHDSVVSGLIIATCGQLELLSNRFMNIPKYIERAMNQKLPVHVTEVYERQLIRQNIRHHIFILKFIDILRETFSYVILLQFIFSSLVISVNVYQLSNSKTIDIEFLSKLLYLTCMLVEFFLYCWFGNELTLKSQEFGESIFKTNWTTLSVKSNKQLLFVTLRAAKGLILPDGFFIVLSLDSFTAILKASYTAFNVLRTSSD